MPDSQLDCQPSAVSASIGVDENSLPVDWSDSGETAESLCSVLIGTNVDGSRSTQEQVECIDLETSSDWVESQNEIADNSQPIATVDSKRKKARVLR